VLLLDGECGLCSRSAGFLKPRLVRPGSLRFVGQQSEEGKSLLARLPAVHSGSDTVVLLRGGQAHIRSTAVLRSVLHLRWWWKALALLGLLVPTVLRDAIYREVAKRRHRWFDPPDHCTF
jgi:predicted DCC family thiol-disulfide oxidoreductase YuxK